MNKWMNVNKVMPFIDEKVLILIDVGENIESGKYLGGGNFKGNWCNRRGKSHCYKVTHWMSLPAKPKD